MPRPLTPLRERLGRLDREQLMLVIERLVARHPDLDYHARLPVEGEEAKVDVEDVVVQVAAIVRAIGHDWRASSIAVQELWPIFEVGKRYETAGDVDNARDVYAAIAHTIFRHYEDFHDEESQVGQFVLDASEALGRLLHASTDGQRRASILAVLWLIIRREEIETGGYGLASTAVDAVKEHATLEERRAIVAKIRAALPTVTGNHERYRPQGAGRTALEILGDDVDAAERIAICEEAGLDKQLVEILLANGEPTRALDVLRRCGGDDLFDAAQALQHAGYAAEAVEIVRAHPAMVFGDEHRLGRWLAEHGVEADPLVDELRAKLSSIRIHLRIPRFEELLALADRVERRAPVLELVRAKLDETPHARALLPLRARVLAASGRIDDARRLLDELNEGDWKRAAIAVAREAAASGRPDVAVPLYERVLDGLRAKNTNPARGEAKEIERELAAARPQQRA